VSSITGDDGVSSIMGGDEVTSLTGGDEVSAEGSEQQLLVNVSNDLSLKRMV